MYELSILLIRGDVKSLPWRLFKSPLTIKLINKKTIAKSSFARIYDIFPNSLYD